MKISFKQILLFSFLGTIYFTVCLAGIFLAFEVNLILGIFILCFWLFVTSLTIVKWVYDKEESEL